MRSKNRKDAPRGSRASAGMPADQRAVLSKLMALASASGIRRNRRKGKPRGKPFKKGEPPPAKAKIFQPGESGNPEGRPPTPPEVEDFDAIMKGAAPRMARVAIDRLEGKHLDANGLTRGLTTPEVRMFENIWALAGRPIPRKVELSGPGGSPIDVDVGPGQAMLAKLAGEDIGEEPPEEDEDTAGEAVPTALRTADGGA